MKKQNFIVGLILLFLLVFGMISCHQSTSKWKLVWSDEFNDQLDTTVWKRIPRGKSDWKNYMSFEPSLVQVKKGNLVLKGCVNDLNVKDTARFLTGGVYTKNKKGFEEGRLEICAKFEDAQGAWPAFWLLPFDNSKWPNGGEIDVMERLNSDAYAYQTVHSFYTYHLKKKEPPHGGKGYIKQGCYNVYAVELYADSLSFFINDKHTFTYPRIKTELKGQFPFDKSFYLLLDMQLGGSWVGPVESKDLPVKTYVDWVRYYKKKK